MHVEAFTNRTFFLARGAAFAPGDAAYSLGDELELCYAVERPDLAGLSPEDVAQAIFGELNPGDSEKPHAQGAFPSLSIGDVVSCRDGSAAWSLAVELEGFSPVDPPVFASEPEHAVHCRKAGS